MTLTLVADGVENPANRARLDDAARLLGLACSSAFNGHLIAVENAPGARPIYGRPPLRHDATLAVGNERRGLSKKTLAAADETVVIPTFSRTITTLNVAAAAAVAAWYVLRGSGPQARTARPELRRPVVLLVGDDHVEVGSSLRSVAAFGFRDVLLDDRGAGWFDGSSSKRREARAAARRHKNPLRVHRASLGAVARFDEIVLVTPSNSDLPLQRERLTHRRQQLIVVGAQIDEVEALAADRLRIATLELEPVEPAPLRLVASIALAEIARQVGRRRPSAPARRTPRIPAFDRVLDVVEAEDTLIVDPSWLLDF